MKKFYFILTVTVFMGFLVNCGSSDMSVTDLKKEIADKKGNIYTLKQEIKIIEEKIKKDTPKEDIKDNRVLINVKQLRYENFVHYITQNGSIEAVNSAFISPEMNGQIKMNEYRLTELYSHMGLPEHTAYNDYLQNRELLQQAFNLGFCTGVSDDKNREDQ